MAAFLPVARAELDPAFSRSSEETTPTAQLKFQYRLFPAAALQKVAVTQAGKPLEFRHTPFANNPLNSSAILVLVDTSVGSSRAPRDHTIEDNKQFIQALLSQAQPGNLIGVCSFANDLVEVAAIGAPFAEIRYKIAHLKADGLGTRIYRQGMLAIEKLAPLPATRKALLILSDGKDEDNGFTVDDLVKTAIKHNVMVFSMGCPETGADVPALGNLEKISSETRGLYLRARMGSPERGARLKESSDFAQAVLESVNSGGEIVVPLASLPPGKEVTFEIVTQGGETFRYVHKRPVLIEEPTPSATPAPAPAVALPSPTANPAPTATPLPSATPSPSPTPTPAPFQPVAPAAKPLATPVPPAASSWLTPARLFSTGTVLVLIAAVVVLRGRKPKTNPDPAPAAFLEMQDAESKRIPLLKTANRIGRRPDNDIVFTNTSISGYHAEIHAQRDGTFYITDLGSGNGLSVNDQRVTQSNLKEGDLIELGEVRFRFYRA
ncbi:MAG: FHA domain-containing protein [Verrucomicrobia bacterium]|nr:FHA domain-containing protein [Verrucomicrobiota bacterium]